MQVRRSSCCMLLMTAAFLAACGEDTSGVIFDDFGPPAGYTVFEGTVLQSGGAAAVGVEVGFGRCTNPVGGFLASARTDGDGRFRATGNLPPIGALPRLLADTLRVRCYVFLDRTGIVRDSVTVGFAATIEAAPVTTLSLEAP